MNRWLGGGAALGLAAVGTLVFAGQGAAQEGTLQATIDPATVAQGEPVTLASVDACVDAEEAPGRLEVAIFFEDETEPFQTDPIDLVPEAVDPNDTTAIESPDGQWALEYSGEPDEPTGTYIYIVTCFPDDPEGAAIGEYVPLVSEVVAATAPTTTPTSTPTPAPAPAAPVSRTPGFNG